MKRAIFVRTLFPGMLAVILLLLLGGTGTLSAQGTAFTYQGRLVAGTNVANGIYDFRFAIYDAVGSGNQQGTSLTNSAVVVTNGLFTVTLNFGSSVFTGANRWLDINVRTNGAQFFSILSPRQPLTPSPYAIFAGAVNATNVGGMIPLEKLGSGTFNAGTVLRGDGTWGGLAATDTNSVSKLNGFGTNTILIAPGTIGMKSTAAVSNGVAIYIPQHGKIVIDATNSGVGPSYDFGKIMIGVGATTNTTGGNIALPDYGTIYAYPFPNNGGYIRFWGSHGGPNGLLMLGGGDIDVKPGDGRSVEFGETGNSIAQNFHFQYRNHPPLSSPLGQSHDIYFAAAKNNGAGDSANVATPSIRGWATVTNEGAKFGELHFYAQRDEFYSGNATATPDVAGIEIFRATTNGVQVLAGKKFIGDGSGLTNLQVNGAGLIGSALPPMEMIWLRDEFIGGAAVSGQLGQYGWQFSANTVSLHDDVTPPNFGTARFLSAASINADAYCQLLSPGSYYPWVGGLHTFPGWTNTFIFKLSSTSSQRFVCGMLTGSPDDPNPPGGEYLRYDSRTNGNFWVVARSFYSGGDSATDTGVAADTNYHKIVIWSESPGVTKYKLDAGTVITIASVSAGAQSPGLGVRTLNATARGFTVDFWEFKMAVTR